MTDMPTFDNPDDWEPPPAQPFRLSGKRLTTGERWSEEFSIMGDVPQGAVADLSAAVSIKDGQLIYTTVAVVRFLKAVLVPIDEQRFDQLLHDKDRPVPIGQLGDVMMWAAGLTTGRPTGPLSSSGGGAAETETGSEAEPASQAEPVAG